jgi:uncharacterized coiled-coil DUF342 family protein
MAANAYLVDEEEPAYYTVVFDHNHDDSQRHSQRHSQRQPPCQLAQARDTLRQQFADLRSEHMKLCHQLHLARAQDNTLRLNLQETKAQIAQLRVALAVIAAVQAARRANRNTANAELLAEQEALRNECNSFRRAEPELSFELQQIVAEQEALNSNLQQAVAQRDLLRFQVDEAKQSSLSLP